MDETAAHWTKMLSTSIAREKSMFGFRASKGSRYLTVLLENNAAGDQVEGNTHLAFQKS